MNTETKPTPLPCPFCGSTNIEPGPGEHADCVAYCNGCNAQGPPVSWDEIAKITGSRFAGQAESEYGPVVIAAWNRRGA